MGFAVGKLIQCLEWERVGEEEVDMEGAGLTVPKAEALVAICRRSRRVTNLLSAT